MIALARVKARNVEQKRAAETAADVDLVTRVARGDRESLGALYDKYAPAAYSLAVRLVGEAMAEDIVHDAFVGLVERRTTFDPARGAFRAWFLTAIHHRCLNALRRRPAQDIEQVADALRDPDPEPVDQIVQRLRDTAARSALVQLPSAQRAPLVLPYSVRRTHS